MLNISKEQLSDLHVELKNKLEKKNQRLKADKRSDINKKKYSLHWLSIYGKTEEIKSLLEQGADVEEADNEGFRPLHWVSIYGKIEVAKILLKQGANIKATDSEGCTSLHLASLNDQIEVAKLLLKQGADIKATDNEKCTSLHLASLNGQIKVAELPLKQSPDIKPTTDEGYTPLHLACMNGQTKAAELLLKQGADIKATTDEGYTPLHLACMHDQTKVAELLLKKGADVEATDNKGFTPLHLACIDDKTEIAKILIDYVLSKNSKIGKPRFLIEHKLSPHWDYTNSKIKPFLEKLEKKAKDLQNRGHTQAYSQAKYIVEQLHVLNQTYFTKEIPYDTYRTSAMDVINKNQSELNKHRGFKKILGNLMIGITTLGAAQVLNKICNGRFLFFKQTSSSKCLENLNNVIKKMENSPRPS